MNRSIIKRALSWGIATLLMAGCMAVAIAQTTDFECPARDRVDNVSGS